MNYTFKNTEINNKKASDFETKSLLYLIGNKKEIEYVTFDCFNDVSGVNKQHDKIWDIQSKNEKSLSPKKIGKYLFTLFDNFISTFSFQEFIFFAPILNVSYKININQNIYNLNNIEEKTRIRILNGLKEEVLRVKGNSIDYSQQIEEFTKKVFIVEDNNTENEYIKSVTKFKKTNIKSDDFYNSVFTDLRNIQTTKKNSYIENETISEIRDVLNFNRHLTTTDVETLIISRIIGIEIFNYYSIPIYFFHLIKDYNTEDVKDIIQECNSNLSRAFFNKNSNQIFWNICEKIITFLNKNDSKDVNYIFDQAFSKYTFRILYLKDLTIKYLISIIIEGTR
ncbi:hypothetical protein AR438_00425 [Chryseobacterium aquaticum]|uniref:CD-NTase associated protein 4-like DNA endonuclease domain-containing protein n=1 Tax=Chryseobacterium aquaticum TaxID=452084 RepID=A0A0Q3PCX5_9FLAO|nr:hypothetical protein [Chryseobacterium aquaticum]KQK27550.1 hypothetical protein AR438_00425 [Chryseobacterium aquaticum]